jgi:hypothetical protein
LRLSPACLRHQAQSDDYGHDKTKPVHIPPIS